MINAGHSGSVTYTGWDGATTDRALAHRRPHRRSAHLPRHPGRHPRPRHREPRDRQHARDRRRCRRRVNAGFFVLDPRSGAPGDPAGIGVYDGRLLSEPVSGRPGLVVHDGGRRSQITRLTWEGRVTARGTTLSLDGIDRVPGLIRNCGGSEDDSPRCPCTT